MVTNNSCDYQPTQYNVQTGGASGTLNNIAPSATSGVPVISQGSSAQPIFGTAVVAGGGTGISSATAYALLAGGTTSTGAHQSLTTGSAGQILSSGGSAALPTWIANSSSGNLVLIQTQTASSASTVNFTTGITATYNNYMLLCTNVIPGTNAVNVILDISTNGGSSYIATGYLSGSNQLGYATSTFTNVNLTSGLMLYGNAGSASYNSSTLFLTNFTSGANYVGSYGQRDNMNASNANMGISVGSYSTTSQTVNAFQILTTSGTISGTFTLYGILE